MELDSRAETFATIAHARVGQIRKYTGAPYIEHPRAVVALVRSVPHDEAMLAAAWLHDTVEDTGVLPEEIVRVFGEDVGSLVEQLTDVSKASDGNRKARKAIDREHTARATPRAKTIKLADLIDNSKSILTLDPKFAVVYLAEKRELLPLLKSGDPTLWAQASAQVADYETRVTALRRAMR